MKKIFILISLLIMGGRCVVGEELEYPALKAAIEKLRSKLESVWALEAKAVADAEAARIAESEAMSAAVAAVEAEKEAAAILELIRATKKRAELRLSAAEDMKKAYEAAVAVAETNLNSGKVALDAANINLAKLREELNLSKVEVNNLNNRINELKKHGADLLSAAKVALEKGEPQTAEIYSSEVKRIGNMIKDKEKELEAKRIIAEEAERRVKLGEALVKVTEDRLSYLEQLCQSIKKRYEKELQAAQLAAKEVESLKESYLAAELKIKALLDARRAAYAFLKQKGAAAKETSIKAEAEVKIAKAEEEKIRLEILHLHQEYKRAIEAIREAERALR